MSCRADEIQTDVNAAVVKVGEGSLYLQFLLEVVFKLGVDVVDYCFEAVFFVDLVAVADRINNGELQEKFC